MLRYFSSNPAGGHENLDQNTKYCFIRFNNVPQIGGQDKIASLFNIYRVAIETKNDGLIKNIPLDFLNEFCDENGDKLLDVAMLAGNLPLVKFLIEEKRVNINYIPYAAKETTVATLLSHISPADEDFLTKVKIICVALKNGLLAFDLSAYNYDDNKLDADCPTPANLVYEEMREQTNYNVQLFIHDCFSDLGIDKKYDLKILKALKLLAGLGFSPCAADEASPVYDVYKLSKIFNIANYKQSYNTASNMVGVIEAEIAACEREFDLKVLEANKVGGFAIEEIIYPDKKNGYQKEQDIEETEEDDGSPDDEIKECLNTIIDMIDDILDNIKKPKPVINYDTQYYYNELLEIANKNQAYTDECDEISVLYKDHKRFNDFQNRVKYLVCLDKHIENMRDKMDYVYKMMAKRYPNEVDNELLGEIEEPQECIIKVKTNDNGEYEEAK